MDKELKRRIRLDLNKPAELAIINAVDEIEKMEPDQRLTRAVCLLAEAKDLVSDFIDGIPHSPESVDVDEQSRLLSWLGSIIKNNSGYKYLMMQIEANFVLRQKGYTKPGFPSREQPFREALEKIAAHYHKDRTCSLEAQGYNEIECAEIGTKDYLASIARTALSLETTHPTIG